jgi:hypothetical protein
MSSNDITKLKFVSEQLTIYIGCISFVIGLFGNTLNLIVFMTLKTFRQTLCALYLTAASAINIVQLLCGLLPRILISGYGIDLTKTSVFLCKIRVFIGFIATLIWLTFICLGVADQFASITIRWRHLCNRRLALHVVMGVILFWCLYGIPYLIFYNVYVPPITGLLICTNTNWYLGIYISRVQLPVLLGCLSLSIQIVFGSLIWMNLHGKRGCRAPIVRLRRDKQLTAMVKDLSIFFEKIKYFILSSLVFSNIC